jgi:hypothetical protein
MAMEHRWNDTDRENGSGGSRTCSLPHCPQVSRGLTWDLLGASFAVLLFPIRVA